MRLSELRIPPGFRVAIAIGEASAEEQKEYEGQLAATDGAMPAVVEMVRARVERDGKLIAFYAMPVESIDGVVEDIQYLIDRVARPRIVE